MNDTTEAQTQATRSRQEWLLLIHSIPPKPDYLRVKVRRRLQRIGAAPLKSSVYVLPKSDEALEDFEWLRREIVADGGEATICEAAFVAGISDRELFTMFEGMETEPGRPEAGGAPPAVKPGSTWVTRQGIKVDRMASAWLIRRFIDQKAAFKFVAPRGYRPEPGELRFDMYEGEFGHESGRCTFETLVSRFALSAPGLSALGQIVHDIDCKDDRYGRAETAGVAALIGGVTTLYAEDEERLERGLLLFDQLLARLASEAP
jgi:hypothetical protein